MREATEALFKQLFRSRQYRTNHSNKFKPKIGVCLNSALADNLKAVWKDDAVFRSRYK